MIRSIKFAMLIMVLIMGITLSACGNLSEMDSGWSQWEEAEQISEDDAKEYDKIISSICDDSDYIIANTHIGKGQYVCELYNKNSSMSGEVVIGKCSDITSSEMDADEAIDNSVFICLRNEISDASDSITSFESFYDIAVELVNELTDKELSNVAVTEFIADESNIVRDGLEEDVVKAKYIEKDGVTMEYYVIKRENDMNADNFKENGLIEELIISTF